MFKIKNIFLVLIFFLVYTYSMEIEEATDSIKYNDSGIIKLKNSFIIPGSVTILNSNHLIDSLDFISGYLYIDKDK